MTRILLNSPLFLTTWLPSHACRRNPQRKPGLYPSHPIAAFMYPHSILHCARGRGEAWVGQEAVSAVDYQGFKATTAHTPLDAPHVSRSNSFKGELKITTKAPMGAADLKKLRALLMDEFPALTKKMLDKLPFKEDVSVHKCANGTQLYVVGDNPPAFFDDGFGSIYPTIFTLWKIPDMMHELVTHGPVSKFLIPKERSSGADMMLPGVIVPDEGLGRFEVGQKRCIRVQGNPAPFGVGKMLVSDADVTAKGMKGKGMAVLHVYRDSLWLHAGRKIPNDGFLAEEVTAYEGASSPAEVEAEAEEEEEEEEAVPGAGERTSGGAVAVEEMEPDKLLEYCFFAALKTSCTDAELPITADKFYSHHMQPARPAGHSQLDAKRTSYKQIGKYIKQMHKAKVITIRDVKNTITILSVDRNCAAYQNFELAAGGSHADSRAERPSGEGAAGKAEAEDVQLRSKPPVVTDLYQPNSYTKPLFDAMGQDTKNSYYTLEEAHKILERYCREKLNPAGSTQTNAPTASTGVDSEHAELRGWLQFAGLSPARASQLAKAVYATGISSVKALRAANKSSSELEEYGASSDEAALIIDALLEKSLSGLKSWLRTAGVSSDKVDECAAALDVDGYDSYPALAVSGLDEVALQASYKCTAADAKAITSALAALDLSGEQDTKPVSRPSIDPKAVPLDDLLIDCLIKLAGGVKKGTTYPSHMGIAELRAKMTERMTPFHKVEVEGEAPLVRKGALKLIHIEMKRAAGHNKTHVSGLESFIISPDAVAQALKVKLGCTTAVLKLPGNNVKDQEVLLQGHCVNEVLEYLKNVYSIDQQWIELKLRESKPK